MTSQSFLIALLLVGLTLVCVNGSCDYESYFTIDVSIEPTKPDFSCDTQKDEKKLKALIQRVSRKKFEKYYNETHHLTAMELEDFCEGDPVSGDRRFLRDGARGLMGMAKWNFVTSSACRFCLPDMDDRDAPLVPDIINMTSVVTTTAHLPPPPPPPSVHPRQTRAESELQVKLQRQLTRALTHKINNNVRSSCMVGSESTVTVNLTAVGDHQPPLVCP